MMTQGDATESAVCQTLRSLVSNLSNVLFSISTDLSTCCSLPYIQQSLSRSCGRQGRDEVTAASAADDDSGKRTLLLLLLLQLDDRNEDGSCLSSARAPTTESLRLDEEGEDERLLNLLGLQLLLLPLLLLNDDRDELCLMTSCWRERTAAGGSNRSDM